MNNTYSCECPKNMELDSDQHTCKPTHKQKTLLLGIGNRFIRFNHQPFGRHNDAKGETINFNIHKITYNSITNDAIAVDNTEKIIYKFNLDSNLVKPLISQNLGIITALTFGKFFQFSSSRFFIYSQRSFFVSSSHRSFGKQFVLE